MFSKLFEERDKTITHLVKLGDCLSRSLRENVSLFSIDSNSSEVTYLTESNQVISGEFEIGADVTLNNIKVQDSSVFEDEEKFDEYVDSKMHTFVESIHFGEYHSADSSFTDLLSLWENRLKISGVQQKLHEKSSRLANIEKIVDSEEFGKLMEVVPQLQEFLKENKEKVSSVPEIRNAVNLSNAVSKAFNFPMLTMENLEEGRSYTLKDGTSSSIYDMVCRQELVKKELIESKKNFDLIWADNASIRKLAGLIFADDSEVVQALSESLQEIPYLALASKKSLFNTFSNCLGQVDGLGVSDKDIQQFASRIFEYKKEVKEVLINDINEKYGVNIQNIQEPASFKSLANTQVVIFEALSRLAPKGSVLKQVLSEMGQSLKTKSGVECIDVNDFLLEIFSSVGYDDIIEEASEKTEKVDLKRVTKEIKEVKGLIKTLQDKVDSQYESDENVDQEALAAEESVPEESVPEETPPEESALPTSPEEEDDPNEDVKVPEVKSKEDAIADLADLEKMVTDIAAELMDDDKEAK